MSFSVGLMKQLSAVEPQLRTVLWTILEEIEQHRETSVTKSEFAELHEIVASQVRLQAETRNVLQQLAETQQRTEMRVEQLAEAQQGLAEAQQRTEMRVEQLAEAQQGAEDQIAQLAGQMRGLRSQVGGLSKSVAYALENEAYRKLPAYLRERHGIIVEKRLIRTTVAGREINLFAHARRAGEEILVVGESVLRLDDVSKLEQTREQVEVVKAEFGLPVVPLLITHFARPEMLALAEAEGIVVAQSFEWDI